MTLVVVATMWTGAQIITRLDRSLDEIAEALAPENAGVKPTVRIVAMAPRLSAYVEPGGELLEDVQDREGRRWR